jgi:hypothetical protein
MCSLKFEHIGKYIDKLFSEWKLYESCDVGIGEIEMINGTVIMTAVFLQTLACPGEFFAGAFLAPNVLCRIILGFGFFCVCLRKILTYCYNQFEARASKSSAIAVHPIRLPRLGSFMSPSSERLRLLIM